MATFNFPKFCYTDSTAQFDYTHPTYTPSAGYSLKIAFSGASTIEEITALTTGDTYNVSATFSTLLNAGSYQYQAYVELEGVKTVVASGSFELKKLGTLSHYQTTLNAINATIQNRATKEQQQITIAGRSIQYMLLEDLIKARSHYAQLVKQEEKDQSFERGDKMGGKILASFFND